MTACCPAADATTNNSIKTICKKDDEEQYDIVGVSTVGDRNRRTALSDDAAVKRENKIARILDAYLIADSEFFDQNAPRALPAFSKEDTKIGKLLGEGEFGTVCQIESFQKQVEGCGCYTSCGNVPRTTVKTGTIARATEEKKANGLDAATMLHSETEAPIAEVPVAATADNNTRFNSDDVMDDGEVSDLDDDDKEDGEAEYMRDYLIHHVYRCGQYRYAIKQVRLGTGEGDAQIQAAVDMAMETKILSSIDHPNIVKVRAIMGTFGKPNDFGIIMDRLNDTLRDKIEHWAVEEKGAKGSLIKRVSGRMDVERRNELLLVRLYALYDIARALKFLHQKNILYRDLKPENVGVNLRGDYLIFDFGLSKELKRKDLIEPPDGFNATGLCGSRRYMAPEVVYCKNYGFSADVYSFSILFWETIALKVPFRLMSSDKHFRTSGGKRESARTPS